MRALVAILLLATMLGGCAEGPQFEPTTSVEETPVETNATVEENLTVEELVPVFTVTIAGNLTEAVNGTFVVPADTNITFDAGNSTGNITTFTWTVGNLTSTGPSILHAFEAGNHTVDLTVAGPDNATASLSIPVEAIKQGESLVATTDLGFSKGSTNVVQGSCSTASKEVEFPAGTTTRRIQLRMTKSFTASVGQSYKVALRDATGAELLKHSNTSGGTPNVIDEVTELPAGMYTVYAEACAAINPNVSFKVTGVAEHWA